MLPAIRASRARSSASVAASRALADALQEALLLADQMCVLHHGTTLQTGTPQDVMTHPQSVEIARLVSLKNICKATVRAHDVAHVAEVAHGVTVAERDLVGAGAVGIGALCRNDASGQPGHEEGG